MVYTHSLKLVIWYSFYSQTWV